MATAAAGGVGAAWSRLGELLISMCASCRSIVDHHVHTL